MPNFTTLPNTYVAPIPQNQALNTGLGTPTAFNNLVTNPDATITSQLGAMGTNARNLFNTNLQSYMDSIQSILPQMRRGESAKMGILPGSPMISQDLTARIMQQIAPGLFGQAFSASQGEQSNANAFQRALAQMVAQAALQRNQVAQDGSSGIVGGVNPLGNLDPSGILGGIGGGGGGGDQQQRQNPVVSGPPSGVTRNPNGDVMYTPQDTAMYPGSGGSPYDARGLTGVYTGSLPGTTGGGADPLNYGTGSPTYNSGYGGYGDSYTAPAGSGGGNAWTGTGWFDSPADDAWGGAGYWQ